MKVTKFISFGVKNAFRRKSIAFLAIFGIAIGISLQVTLNTFSNGMSSQFDDLFNEIIGEVNVAEETFVDYQSNIPTTVISDLDSSLLGESIDIISPEINLPESLTSSYSMDGTLPAGNIGTVSSIAITGVDLDTFMVLSSDLDELVPSSNLFSSNELEAVISYSLYDANSSVFNIGEEIIFKINASESISIEIVGITENAESSFMGGGHTGSFQTSYDIWTSVETANSIITDILSDQSVVMGSSRFLHFESKGLDSSLLNADSYSSLTIKTSLTTTEETETFIVDLDLFLEDLYNKNFEVTAFELALDSFTSTQDSFLLFINIISIVGVLAGSMGIIIAQLVGVESRLKEFAILKASGWKNKHLVFEVIIESLSLGIMGAIAGLVLSVFFVGMLGNAFGGIGDIISVSPSAIVNAIGIAIVIAIIGGLYPSIKVSSVKPMEILRSV